MKKFLVGLLLASMVTAFIPSAYAGGGGGGGGGGVVPGGGGGGGIPNPVAPIINNPGIIVTPVEKAAKAAEGAVKGIVNDASSCASNPGGCVSSIAKAAQGCIKNPGACACSTMQQLPQPAVETACRALYDCATGFIPNFSAIPDEDCSTQCRINNAGNIIIQNALGQVADAAVSSACVEELTPEAVSSALGMVAASWAASCAAYNDVPGGACISISSIQNSFMSRCESYLKGNPGAVLNEAHLPPALSNTVAKSIGSICK